MLSVNLASIALTVWLFLFAISLIHQAKTRRPWLAVLCLLAGWLTLPVADYPQPFDRILHSRWGMGQFLFGAELNTRLFQTSLGAWAVAIVHCWRHRPARPRLGAMDGVAAALPLASLLSALAADADLSWIAMQFAYLSVTWLGWWSLGRVLAVASPPISRDALAACVVAGLFLLASVAEFLAGPWLYTAAYGVHPFEDEGHQRAIFNRPLLAFEDGNQYGLAVAMLAVFALTFWIGGARPTGASERTRAWEGIAAWAASFVALASQSRGALLLGGGVLVLLGLRRRRWLKIAVAGLTGVTLLVAAFQFAGILSADRLINRTEIGRQLKSELKSAGLGSFGWRVGLGERYFPLIRQRPLLGYGHANWWQGSEASLRDVPPLSGDRPWPFVILIAGAYGITGLIGAMAALAIPTLRTFVRTRDRPIDRGNRLRIAIALVLGVQIGDIFFNSTLLPASLALAGYLATKNRDA